MLARLNNWLDERTGYRWLLGALLLERISGGAKWRFTWGSCLAFVFLIELITGLLLMTVYSPSDNSAWASVYYIQYQMDFGWLIRGLHRFGSYALVVLLGIHMLQVVIAGAHLPPREFNWWLGLILLMLVLALGLSGNVLPWDQNGYEAIKVEANITSTLPVVGPWLAKMILGGPEPGNLTLTRLHGLHVGILPLLTIVLAVIHLALYRRHGVSKLLKSSETSKVSVQEEDVFWPAQAFRDMVVCMIVFGILLGVVLWRWAAPAWGV